MKEVIGGLLSEEVGAPANVILSELVRASSLIIVYGVRPQDIAEEALPRGLLESL